MAIGKSIGVLVWSDREHFISSNKPSLVDQWVVINIHVEGYIIYNRVSKENDGPVLMHGPERCERCEKLCPLILKDNTDWLPLDEWHCVLKSLVEVRMHLGVDLQLKVTPDIAINGYVDVIAQANIHSVGEFDLVIPD